MIQDLLVPVGVNRDKYAVTLYLEPSLSFASYYKHINLPLSLPGLEKWHWVFLGQVLISLLSKCARQIIALSVITERT